MKKFLLLVVALMCFGVLSNELQAQDSPKISIQGTLKDDNAAAATDGAYEITFRLYHQQIGGTHVWQEMDTVDVKGGIYSHELGSKQELTTAIFANTVYLAIEVGGLELGARTEMTYAPYALAVASTQRIARGGCSGAIGDIKYSILNPTEFSEENGSCWVPMDGRAIPNTVLADTYGWATVPDMSGLFIRAQEYHDGNDPDRTPASAIAQTQQDANKPHTHTMEADGAHSHQYDDSYFHRFRTDNNATSSNTEVTISRYGGLSAWVRYGGLHNRRADFANALYEDTTESAGDHTHTINLSDENESRPKNKNFYIYIRVD